MTKNLAAAYQAAGRLRERCHCYEAALKGRQATLGPEHPDTLNSMTQPRASLSSPTNPPRPKPCCVRPWPSSKKSLRTTGRRSRLRSLLGASLLGQKKFAEAEPFLLESYEGMKSREPKIPRASRKAWPRPANGSSRSTTPGASKTKPRNGSKKLETSR